MKKSTKNLLAGALAVPMLALGLVAVAPVATYAKSTDTSCNSDSMTISNGMNCARGTGTPDSLFGDGGIFQTITNIALYLIGAISVLMLIYGGIRYTLSAGRSDDVEAAKNTIMYAVIGIVVAILAYAIVNFVLTNLIGTTS